MHMASDDDETSVQAVPAVTSSVLGSFFDALADTDDLKEIAAALRTLVLDDGVFAEPAVRAAMFPDAS